MLTSRLQMGWVATVMMLLALPISSSAAGEDKKLELHRSYTLRAAVGDFAEPAAPGVKIAALANSSFTVESITDTNYLVQFFIVYGDPIVDAKAATNSVPALNSVRFIQKSTLYQVPIGALSNQATLADLSKPSTTGLSAGPLIVPFKWRLDDKSISGEASLGAYAGVTFNAPFLCRSGGAF